MLGHNEVVRKKGINARTLVDNIKQCKRHFNTYEKLDWLDRRLKHWLDAKLEKRLPPDFWKPVMEDYHQMFWKMGEKEVDRQTFNRFWAVMKAKGSRFWEDWEQAKNITLLPQNGNHLEGQHHHEQFQIWQTPPERILKNPDPSALRFKFPKDMIWDGT